MGVYEDYPKRYPKRKDLFEEDGVNSKYGESKIPVPRPPVYKISFPVSELGKDPLPVIVSAKPSRIPTPKRLSFVENNGEVLSSLSSTTLVEESTPKRIPIEENNEEEGQILSKLSSNTAVVPESVAPSTGGNSSKPSAPSDSFTQEKINVAAVITSFDALCNSSTVPLQHTTTVPLKPIGSITKTLFADAIPAANISGNVERIVKEINNAVPLLENISKIKEQKLEAAPAQAQAAEASPATSSTALSTSCSSSTSSSSLSASSEMTDTSTDNEITLLTEALTSGRGDGAMVQFSETTYYPSETTYFPSTAQSSQSSLSTIPEETEEEFCENEEDSSPDDNALPEPKKDKILVEISKTQLIEVIEWIEEERTRIKAKIHRLKTAPVKNYSCMQLARQGVFNRCMDTINWAKVTFNQFF